MSTGGRGVWNRKIRVDEVMSIDILDLQRKEVFSKGLGWSWTLSWSRNGKVIASISYRVETDEDGPFGLRFIYTITDNETSKKKDFYYIIPVVSTHCNYGGKRWWYICPLVVNGCSCQRRCRIVYLPPGSEYFGCRECHRLTYKSRQCHRDKFYESFIKPGQTFKRAHEEYKKARSWKKKDNLFKKMKLALTQVERFEKMLTSRTPKIIYKEK